MHSRAALWISFGLAISTLAWTADQSPLSVEDLIARITSDNVDTRYAARSEAAAVGAPAVAPLTRLLDGALPETADARKLQREIGITARAALENVVHHAGRSGADSERQAVAREIARLLDAKQSPKTQRELLFLIAFIGADREVPSVARLLYEGDPTVSETARFALERIPCKAATQALLAAAERQPDKQKPDLLIALGRKAEPSTFPALIEFARSGKGQVQFAALKALAHAGAREAVPLFVEVLESPDVPARIAVWNEFLRLADNLEEASQLERAAQIYRLALKAAPRDHQRERALLRLSKGGVDMEILLAGLGDPSDRVRKLALRRTNLLKGPEVLATLRKAYEGAGAEARPTLLRVLAEKDMQAAAALIEEALRSSQVELMLTALDITDQLERPELESVYLEAAKAGPPRAKPIALRGYLLLAARYLKEGKGKKALGMYGEALDLATELAQRAAALEGLIRVGDPAALERLEGTLKDSALAAESAKGVITLAGKLGASGEVDAAEGYLMQVVTGHLPKDLRNQAADELRRLGRDPHRAIQRQGFVTDWWVVTPIQDPEGKGLEIEYFPEKGIDLEKVHLIGPRRFRWQKLTEISLDGKFNLLTSFRRTTNVLTYAFTEMDVTEARDVLFKMGSDDGIACWLNGDRIHLNNAARGWTLDQDVVKARLQAGKNRILLKINNGSADWAFSLRITDPQGRPLNLTRQK